MSITEPPMKSLCSNLGTVLCALQCSVVYYLCYTLSLSHTVHKLLQRLFMESDVIVFHDSYIILP